MKFADRIQLKRRLMNAIDMWEDSLADDDMQDSQTWERVTIRLFQQLRWFNDQTTLVGVQGTLDYYKELHWMVLELERRTRFLELDTINNL